MYRHCIYCSADMGANEALESFPVGRTLAFDARRGRLWAVCGKCARWNLAPFEERWEPVEDAERLFRDARMRVQSENIGLAKLRDGTKLIRVGAALQGEMAAWRYGAQLERRRRSYLLTAGAMVAGGVALAGGLATMLTGGLAITAVSQAVGAWERRQIRKVVVRVSPGPGAEPIPIRRWHLYAATLRFHDDALQLHVPLGWRKKPLGPLERHRRHTEPPLLLDDAATRRTLQRAMVLVNRKGGSAQRVQEAAAILARAETPENLIVQLAREGPMLAKRHELGGHFLLPNRALALEMALHEEQERRALEGELSVLEAAWRDAEPIADIADRLAIAPTQTE
jgi:hypothetical protein